MTTDNGASTEDTTSSEPYVAPEETTPVDAVGEGSLVEPAAGYTAPIPSLDGSTGIAYGTGAGGAGGLDETPEPGDEPSGIATGAARSSASADPQRTHHDEP